MERFIKCPNKFPTANNGHMILISQAPPDVVILPSELGGQTVVVKDVIRAKCPMHEHDVPTYILENDIFVAECDQFYWYKI